MKTVFELLNHDNTISVNRRLAHALGLSEAVIYAALLAKHAWYEQHGKLSDGWFYSTVDDMEESTSLTKCQQSRCVKRLVSAGLIRCAAKGLPARRFFCIVDDPQLLEGIIGVCEPSPEENAPAVRSEASPQEVRKSDSWQAGITAAGSAGSSQKTKDNKTKENKPENIKPDSAQLEAARSRINHAGLSRKYGSGFADLAAEVTHAAAEVCHRHQLPLSVKIRAGFDRDHINAPDFACRMADAGADRIALHCRTRAELYTPGIHPEVLEATALALSAHYPAVSLIGNGDVTTVSDALAMLHCGAAGVMIGRGALGNPWIFRQIGDAHAGRTPYQPDKREICETAIRLVHEIVELRGERSGIRESRGRAAHFIVGMPGSAAVRASLWLVAPDGLLL